MNGISKMIIGLTFLLSTLVYAGQAPSSYTEKNLHIMVSASQPQFEIKLKSNATTGYSWFLRKYNSKLIEPVKHVYQAPQNKGIVGAPGVEVWTFRVKASGFVVPQQTIIRMVYARPWEGAEATEQLNFTVTMH